MYIFLDDERMPGDVTWVRLPDLPNGTKWAIVRSFDEFKNLIDSLDECPDHISFDHDLGFGHGLGDWQVKNGKDCAQYLLDKCVFNSDHSWGLKFPEYTVHSMNPVGARNIDLTMKDWFKFLSGQ